MAEVFSDRILVEAGAFETVCFDAKIGRTIEISAWEVDRERFDIFLVREDEVGDDYFRDDDVMVSERNIASFYKTYHIPQTCEACVVLSNPRAISRPREIHLRLTWVREYRKRPLRDVFSLQSTALWRIVFTLILIVPLLFAVTVFSLTGDPLLSSLVLAGGYPILVILSGIYNKELRARLG